MSRTGLWTEILAPAGALLVAVVAAALQQPAALVALAVIWFAPALLRRVGSLPPLDEREEETDRLAQQISLSTLLVAVTVLPYLLSFESGEVVRTLALEWLDVGFLVVAIFYVRAGVMLHRTVPRAWAAQLGSLGACAIAAIGIWGAAIIFPGRVPPWFLAAPLACLFPNLVALKWRRLAGVMWLGGAALTALWSVTAPDSLLEKIICLLMLALPWAVAGYWSFSADDQAAG